MVNYLAFWFCVSCTVGLLMIVMISAAKRRVNDSPMAIAKILLIVWLVGFLAFVLYDG